MKATEHVDLDVRSFEIGVPDEQLADLRERLHRTRWAERETVQDRSQGLPLTYLQDLHEYWANGYDWRVAEQRINAFPQVRTTIDGVDLHVLHVRSPEPDATPLVMTHGWPGSIIEFLEVLGPLTDPVGHGGDRSDAFHLVCPSLPGFGFSAKPRDTGWGVERIADAWVELMSRLGYERFAAQGGDRGGRVAAALGLRHSDRVSGIHLSGPSHFPVPEDDARTDAERASLERVREYREWESAYAAVQSTRPQTVGYGLVDSPLFQAAWIVEKLWAWVDHGGDLGSVLTRDQILDNVMMYWLTATGASAARSYWEGHRAAYDVRDRITVPMGMSIHPADIYQPSRRWTERVFTDIRYWREVERGGHFAAFEQPDLFVAEVRACFRELRRTA